MPNFGTNLGLAEYGLQQGQEMDMQRKLRMDQLAQFDQALSQQRADNLAKAHAADYLQNLAATAVTKYAPGTSASTDAMSAGKNATAEPEQMSLQGLMKYLKDNGVEGQDAYNAAQQFMPFLSAQDQQELKQQQYQLQLQDRLIKLGFDQNEAKQKAAELAERQRHDRAMEEKGGASAAASGLDKQAQQLTTGAQALAERRSSIVNTAKNQNRPLTQQEQAQILDLDTRIQKVKRGIEAIRAKQAKLKGVSEAVDDDGGQ